MSTQKLLPCFVCGGDARLNRDGYSLDLRVRCDECGARTEDFETDKEAIAAWNRRASPPAAAFDPAKSPGHTDMMVSPESLDEWLNKNPLPPAAVPDGLMDALKSAEKALRPFFNAVFNDNGDMTVHGGYRYHEAVAGYWAYKRVRDAISAAPAAPTEAPNE